jgi:hypothetical protein
MLVESGLGSVWDSRSKTWNGGSWDAVVRAGGAC